MSVLCVCDLQIEKNTARVSVLIHHGLPRVKWCTEFKASVTNSSKHTLFTSRALSSILAVLISYCPVNLYFNLLFLPVFAFLGFFCLFVCCCFLHILSYHLCHISFSWQSSLCSGLDFLFHSDFILSVYLKQHKAEQQKHCGVGKRHISMSGQWWIRILKFREKNQTLYTSQSDTECMSLHFCVTLLQKDGTTKTVDMFFFSSQEFLHPFFCNTWLF